MRKIQVLSGRAALEAVDAVQHGKPGLLNDLLGDRAARDVHLSHAQERALVHANELLEDALVARAQRLYELQLLLLLRGMLHGSTVTRPLLARLTRT